MTIASLRHWRAQDGREGTRLYMWCPGCDDLHAVEIKDDRVRWEWDGNLEAPTVSPSILVNGLGDRHPRCHSYVRAGHWEFLGDCEHPLVGQTVEMVALPEWVTRDGGCAYPIDRCSQLARRSLHGSRRPEANQP